MSTIISNELELYSIKGNVNAGKIMLFRVLENRFGSDRDKIKSMIKAQPNYVKQNSMTMTNPKQKLKQDHYIKIQKESFNMMKREDKKLANDEF